MISIVMIGIMLFLSACSGPVETTPAPPPKSGITIRQLEKSFAKLYSDSWYFKPVETDSGYTFEHGDSFLTISGASDKEQDVNMIQMAVSSVGEETLKIMADRNTFYKVVKTLQTEGAGKLNFRQFIAGYGFLAYTSLVNEIDPSFNENFNVARSVDEASDLFSQALRNGESSPVQYGEWTLRAAWDKTNEILKVTTTFGK